LASGALQAIFRAQSWQLFGDSATPTTAGGCEEFPD
jgi:hypothetical protein